MLYEHYHRSKIPYPKLLACVGCLFVIIVLGIPLFSPLPPIEEIDGYIFQSMQDDLKEGTWLVA